MNPIKFCSCWGCRAGLHRGKWGGFIARRVIRRFRHLTKLAIRRGEEVPAKLSVPYTD